MDRLPPVHAITSLPAPPTCAPSSNTPKPPVYRKMEALVREMQDGETGIPIRSQKLFLTSIPSAFMGYDLIEWLMERLDIEDSTEAIHLANLLCQFGYFFPVGESRSLIVKDDSSLYRFQTPYYWPSQNHSADTTDYAIYLTKRLSRNKQKHGLEDYELETYTKLKKGLQHKWDFVTMQAEEQVRLAKERKKGDKIVTDSQERAYWRVYRPPQGFTNCLEVAPVPDKTNMANRVRKKTAEDLQQEIEFLNENLDRTRSKVSVISEALISYWEVFSEYDPFFNNPNPSNPWISNEEDFWQLNDDFAEPPTERRVKRWAINFWELISDPLGLSEFTNYLRKEYAHENIRFWQAVNELRYGPSSAVHDTVDGIFEEFLKPGAPCEINIDGKTMEETQQLRKQPTRYTYDLAAEHVYVLNLKKDCYPRYLRSDDYKNLLASAVQSSVKKQRFFLIKSGPGRKKTSTSATTSNSLALVAVTPQPIKRLGSDEYSSKLGFGGGDEGGATAGGIHVGGTPTPPLSSHRLDCDPPYSSEDQSAVCPWETASVSNICPWETAEPPPQTTRQQLTSQTSGLQQQHSFRMEGTSTGGGSGGGGLGLGFGGTKGKPPDRSVSVDVSTLSSRKMGSVCGPSLAASGAPHLAPSASDSKVTLNVCPWEDQELPQKQEKAKSIDNESCPWETAIETAKKGSATSIPSIVSSSQETLGDKSPSGSLRSCTDRRPSIHEERKVSSTICPWEDDSTTHTSPKISLTDLSSSNSTQQPNLATETATKSRLSTDLSNVKISIQTSSEAEKPMHRELSASVSVPCTSLVGQPSSLDYSVRSGHLSGQFSGQQSSAESTSSTGAVSLPHSTSTHVIVSSSGQSVSQSTPTVAISTSVTTKSDKSMTSASVPCTPSVKRTEAPKTVSVSSQTQTDPIIHHKTNQQTQYPSRESTRYSMKHQYRHSKQTSTASQYAEYPMYSKPSHQQKSQFSSSSGKLGHMQVVACPKPPDNLRLRQQQQQVVTTSVRPGGESQQQSSTAGADNQTRQYYITREAHEKPAQKVTQHSVLQHQDELTAQQVQQLEHGRHHEQQLHEKYQLQQKHQELRQLKEEQQRLYQQHRLEQDIQHQKEMQQYEQQLLEFQEQQQRYQEKRVQELASIQKHSLFLVPESEGATSLPATSGATGSRCISTGEDSTLGRKSLQSSQQLHISSVHQQPQISSSQQHEHQSCSVNSKNLVLQPPSLPSTSTLSSGATTCTSYSRQGSVAASLPTTTPDKSLQTHEQPEKTPSSHDPTTHKASDDPQAKKSSESVTSSSSSPKKEEGTQKVWDDPGDICPWEDEESCKVDTPFVKTYATLGYL